MQRFRLTARHEKSDSSSLFLFDCHDRLIHCRFHRLVCVRCQRFKRRKSRRGVRSHVAKLFRCVCLLLRRAVLEILDPFIDKQVSHVSSAFQSSCTLRRFLCTAPRCSKHRRSDHAREQMNESASVHGFLPCRRTCGENACGSIESVDACTNAHIITLCKNIRRL